MSLDVRDDIDRAIDEVLSAVTSGEPCRVSATSVRQAIGETRRGSLPAWFAVAAVFLIGLGFGLKSLSPVEKPTDSTARSADASTPVLARPAPSPEPLASRRTVSGGVGTSEHLRAEMTIAPYEGLPRLTIASLDPPDPLPASRPDPDPIRIADIEIAPLAFDSLSTEQEQN